MRIEEHYPNIQQVIVDMAASEGAIDREQSMPEMLRRVEECVESRLMGRADMVNLDDWLGRLTPEELACIASGEEEDAVDLLYDSPEMACGDYFGEVPIDIAQVI